LSNPVQPVPSSSFPSLMEDIIALLASAYREPVALTLKKGIRRNALDRIFAGSLTGQETPEYFSEEQRDTFVADYLGGRNLLAFGEREATVTPELDGWLNLSMTERTHDVIAFALRHVLGDSQTIVPFAGIMTELPAGTLIDPDGLARFLHERTPASGSAARIQSRTQHMLSILHYLGILLHRNGRFIMTGTGIRFFHGERLPIDESISDRFTLQPNFEALAGPELDLRTRFTLELMSYRKGRDIVVTSVVSRGGVAQARERGMSASEIMRFFESRSRTLIPQNVRFSIESWAKAYGNIRFEPVMLMRFHDSAICDSVMHMPEMRHYIRERLSDTIITVPAERIRVIAGILRQSGFLPEIPGESVPDPARSGEKYNPSSVPEILSEYALPDTRKNFVFPDEELTETETDKDDHE
ncbi:MAG: helicase-associated domain-containing protein, partial [Candidatus Latescibacterota bacterium]